MSPPTVLYLTYHGLASALGRAQCLPYLLRLAQEGHARLLVVSFESEPLPSAELRARVRSAGIRWIELRYHGRPKGLAKVQDIALGLWAAWRITRGERVDVVHARSYVMAALALVLSVAFRAPYVFEMLGMLADEYADVGHWRRDSAFYRMTKILERVLLRTASAVITCTERNAAYLRRERLVPTRTPVVVVPCCVDLDRFACAGPDGFPRAGAPRLVYSGGLGTWYMLDEMLDLFAAARRRTPGLRFLILARSGHELARAGIAARGLPDDAVEVRSVPPDDVARHLCESDVGVSFIRPVFSKHAASPNKFGEYLASGLPVISNAGVGDIDAAYSRDDIGELLTDLDDRAYTAAWDRLVARLRADAPSFRARCRMVAARELGAAIAVGRYADTYSRLTSTP